jgi:hypothetical protein
VAQVAAPALLLVKGLSDEALTVLRLAVAFGGECPTAPHLPALIDVDHGESALRELVDCGLAEVIGGHHRLTAGVLADLDPQWSDDPEITGGAAQHFSWWVGHSSVSAGQIAAEAEVVLGALYADQAAGHTDAVLRLARAAAPAFALTLRWGAWREVLELGLTVARQAGRRREEAWFQHELGVFWLCLDERRLARNAADAAGVLRAADGDQRALAATRRLLTLLQEADRPALAAEAETQVIRRPVIRALASRSLRTAAAPVDVLRGWSRRSVLLAAAGLLGLGVVGTAVALAGGDSGGGPQPAGGGTTSVPMLTGGTATAAPSAGASASDATTGAPTGPTATGPASASAPDTSGTASADSSTTATRTRPATPTGSSTGAPAQTTAPAGTTSAPYTPTTPSATRPGGAPTTPDSTPTTPSHTPTHTSAPPTTAAPTTAQPTTAPPTTEPPTTPPASPTTPPPTSTGT